MLLLDAVQSLLSLAPFLLSVVILLDSGTDFFWTTRQQHRFQLQRWGICLRTLLRTILWEEDNGVNVM